jgi:hypothetical protein
MFRCHWRMTDLHNIRTTTLPFLLNFDALRRQAVSTRGGIVLRMIEHGLTTRQRAGFETLAQAPCRAASGFGQHSRGLIVAAHAPLSGKCRIIGDSGNQLIPGFATGGASFASRNLCRSSLECGRHARKRSSEVGAYTVCCNATDHLTNRRVDFCLGKTKGQKL